MSHLEAAHSLLDLARRLGATCLEHEDELAEMTDQKRTREEMDRLEAWTGQVSYTVWEEVIADPGEFEKRFGSKVVTRLHRAKTRHPLDCLGVLRGLCRRPLGEFFRIVLDQVNLDRGLPVPFATRPLPDKLGAGCTTSLSTQNNTNLLDPLPFDLYRPSGGQVTVVLDFALRNQIDELTWSSADGLPRIATLHPEGGGDVEIETIDEGRFFGVRPRNWDPGKIAKLLEAAKAAGARIAVLPELSLPSPGALEEMLEDKSEDFPAIVVAGSAHFVDGGSRGSQIRANESRIYLGGRYVAMARKHHAFRTNELDGEEYEEPLREDLSREKKTIMVLSGSHTRLAAVICADLIGHEIPDLLVAAGVNLLLAPAMTREIGSFNSPLGDVAGYCQGVAAVANTRWGADGKPFLCMCAVPREEPAEQTAALAGGGRKPAPLLAIFDPNKPLPGAVSWPDAAMESDG